MKVCSVIEDNIFTYPDFTICNLYYFVSWFECARALVANKVSLVCARETDITCPNFECNEDPASGPEKCKRFMYT